VNGELLAIITLDASPFKKILPDFLIFRYENDSGTADTIYLGKIQFYFKAIKT
jgi:hypothetical protein